jgi:peptide/nickel transport system permease protein
MQPPGGAEAPDQLGQPDASPQARPWTRWARMLRSPMGASTAALLGLILVLAVFAPMIWMGRANAIDTDALSQGASGEHWLGTDNLGRDIFARVLVATRLSVELALLATALGVVVGVVLGSVPVWAGARAGRIAAAVVNIAVAFPSLLLALFFAVIFGVGIKGAVLAIGLAMAPWYARVTQTLVAGIQERDYISAAQIAGVGRLRILLRHVLPNIGEPLVVNATLGAGGALLAFAGLSFLGLGVQPPDYDWGLLLNEGLNGIYLRPAGALAPGVAIVLAGLAFNLFGEVVAKEIGLRSARTRADTPRDEAPADAARPAGAAADPDAGVVTGGDDADLDAEDADRVLVVEGLRVSVPGAAGTVRPVREVSFAIGRGEAVGVVGESGSGKSLTALAVAQLIEEPVQVSAGRLEFLGVDLLARGKGTELVTRRVLGTSFGLVFQDPTTSLNPTMRIGPQLAEPARRHQGTGRTQALARAVERLRAVRVPAAARRVR